MRRPLLSLCCLAAIAMLAAACGGGEGGLAMVTPVPEANVFANPSFEEGRDPWFSLKPPDFTLAQGTAHTGEHSALLELRASPEDEGAKVYYLVQEVTPSRFPDIISGYYRVDRWIRGTRFQYLQFVVIAIGADNMPGGYPNHQIRYILAGIDQPPFKIANGRFVFLNTKDPPLNQWVPFQVRVREDFLDLWGAVPRGYEKIRVLFEVRYDNKARGEGPGEADVYYDDLYFGPAP